MARARRRKAIDLRRVTVVAASKRVSMRAALNGAPPFLGFTLCDDSKQTVFDAPSAEEGERWVRGLLEWQEYFRYHAKIS